MTRGAAISIAILALVALALILLLGRHSGAAGSSGYKPASQTQANEINRATGRTGTCSAGRQCHIDPRSRKDKLMCDRSDGHLSSHGSVGFRCDLWLSALTMTVSVAACRARIPAAP